MDVNRLEQQMRFLVEVDKMKSVYRRTILIDKTRRESDAEHSWHFALMAMLLAEYADPEKVDCARVIRMALVHDLIEIYAGDTFAYDVQGNQDKRQRETEAADKLFALLPEDQAAEIRALWEEFDAMETPDAQYAAAIDRLQPFLNNYLTQGHTWGLGGVKSAQVYERMDPIRVALPEVWPFVHKMIQESIEKGYLEKECS